MAEFLITGPDGSKYHVAGPDGATEQDALAQVQAQHGGGQPSPASNDGPQGVEGSIYNNVRGWLHGMSSTVGAPVDLVNAGLSRIGLPVSKEPFMGSAFLRNAMDVPGHALGLKGHATYSDINEVPDVYRPQARFGEVMGSTLPAVLGLGAAATGTALGADTTGATLAAARAAPTSAIKGAVTSQLAQAATPGFTSSMLPGTLGAGAGAYGAETLFPGSEAGQFIGTLAGGGLAGGAAAGGTALTKKLTEPLSTLTDSGARKAIAGALAPQFEKHGEDVSQIIKNLQQTPAVPGALPAEQSGSNVLMGAQNNLAGKSEDLANAIKANQGQYEQNLTGAVSDAFKPGNQLALRQAAQAKQAALSGRLDDIVNRADAAAKAAVAPVSPLGPEDAQAANHAAMDAVEKGLASARATENGLWSRVPQKAEVQPEATVAAYNKIKDEMLPEDSLPGVVQPVLGRFKKAVEPPEDATAGMSPLEKEAADFMASRGAAPPEPPKPITFQDLQQLRSTLLNQSRMARSNGDFNTARRLGVIADGAMEDMGSIDHPAVGAAMQFSKELNDKFSRSFAGQLLGLESTGARSIPPGQALYAASTGNPALAAQKFQELRTAAGTNAPDMQSAQEQFLRSLATNKGVYDASTGQVKPAQAATFLRNYAPILQDFPTFHQGLQKATAAQMASNNISDSAAAATKAAQSAAFSKVLKAGEVPSDAVSSAINGANPVQDITKISALARSGGADSVAGLRSAVLDHVIGNSTKGGSLSFSAAEQALSKPLNPGGPSLLDLMKSNKVFAPGQADDIMGKIKLGVAHEQAPGNAARIDSVGDESGFIARSAARVLGAKLASHLGVLGGGAGPSLQVASVAASAAEKALAGMPVDRAKNILIKALQSNDPEELIGILRRVQSTGVNAPRQTPNAISLLRPLRPHDTTQPNSMSPADIIRSYQSQ